MSDELPRPPWQMDWTGEARQEFERMPPDGRQLVLAARAELVTAPDPYYRGIDADAALPHWITVRPLASTSPGGAHIADLAGGRGWLVFTFVRRHAEPQITVTDTFWA
ncbi:hypothetical protein AB0D66_28960 [Streptomyces sp. NPDC048270]|uniref:hypothetical protein n=1 Tax=Streptomyces sp. NPDC048270 TaxID=3154615 RepID=UPI0033C85E86